MKRTLLLGLTAGAFVAALAYSVARQINLAHGNVFARVRPSERAGGTANVITPQHKPDALVPVSG